MTANAVEPEPAVFAPNAIPDELIVRPQWGIWKREEHDGLIKKVPYRADGRGRAKSTDPSTWATFDEAVAAVLVGGLGDGIFYAMTEEDDLFLVDLDDAINGDGQLHPDAAAVVFSLDTYSEWSQSGKGVHCLGRGRIVGDRHQAKAPWGGKFETWDHSRFVYLTGDLIRGAPTTIERRQAELERVVAEFLPAPAPAEPRPVVPVSLDDQELLEIAMRAKNGADFRALWEGNLNGHESQSEADLDLSGRLAFYWGRDPARIDRMFRASGLFRDKWDERRGDTTYGALTIAKAAAECRDTYTPPRAKEADGATTPAPIEPAADLLAFKLSDLGNARRYSAMHRGTLLYSREEDRWLEWDGNRWRRDVTGSAERAAKKTVEEFWRQVSALPAEQRTDTNGKPTEIVKWALSSQSAHRLGAMLKLASTEPDMVVRLEHLDADPYLLSCGNGTLDLRTGELRAADPLDRLSLGTDIAYHPGAPLERWLRFLEEVFAGDQDLIAFVKRAYGSALTGDTRDRACFIEWGSRFNGKSTLNRGIQLVLGDHAHTAPIRVVMRTRQAEIPNEVAALHRKRLVIIAETADGHRLDEGRVKMLTGRDKVPARFLHREWFNFEPEYKLILYTNFRPKVDGSDGAIWDRIRLIPFKVSFADREDKNLDAKLASEAEGILAWLVEGCLEWQRDGLGTCDAVEQATAAYHTENDTIGRFIAECCELDDRHRIERKTLRAALARYCEESGDEVPPATTVGRWLSDRGIRDARIDGKHAYRGIRLAMETSQNEDTEQ